MVTTYRIEALESVVAPGKGSAAYNAGYVVGQILNAVVTLGGLLD